MGEVAARAGVTISALHFYEGEGLIKAHRNGANHRRYPRAVLRRIGVIKVAQSAGIPLKEIKAALAAIPVDRAPTGADWRRVAQGWQADLTDRIDKLTRLRDQLVGCIGCGCLTTGQCPLRNRDDVLFKQGPGAQLLDPGPKSDEV
nr:redox-sensitive transcriptional activator SoxR [Woodsholea maritima]